MARLMVTLETIERDALWDLAQREQRDPRAQAALIIRRELERLGLLPREAMKSETKAEVQHDHTTA